MKEDFDTVYISL